MNFILFQLTSYFKKKQKLSEIRSKLVSELLNRQNCRSFCYKKLSVSVCQIGIQRRRHIKAGATECG